jgi:hypothetical protein
MRYGILNDQRLDRFRPLQSDAQSNGTAVVLHDQCVALHLELVDQARHYIGKMIKCVFKLIR